tara:strand:- start:20681 stop:20998 length:318 start_codon:yes stop_codon:yes gene_type:complete
MRNKEIMRKIDLLEERLDQVLKQNDLLFEKLKGKITISDLLKYKESVEKKNKLIKIKHFDSKSTKKPALEKVSLLEFVNYSTNIKKSKTLHELQRRLAYFSQLKS